MHSPSGLQPSGSCIHIRQRARVTTIAKMSFVQPRVHGKECAHNPKNLFVAIYSYSCTVSILTSSVQTTRSPDLLQMTITLPQMCNQWTSRLCHQWGLSSPPDDPVNAYVHSSNLDTNIDLTNNKNYVTPSSSNKVNYSFTNQTCTDICLWNARSIVNKLHNFSSFVYTSNYQIVAVTETWLTSSIYNNEILPSNFAIYRNDRGTRGEGVLLAVNLSIPSKIVSCLDDIEAIVIELFPQHPVKLCLVYNPPNTGLLYQQKLISFLSDIMQTDGNVIILGDFSTPDIDWHTLTADSNFSIQLCNLIFQYNYSQVVTSPTHEHGNLLDLVITNNDDIISDVQVHSEGTFIKSDHYLVSFKLKSILNKERLTLLAIKKG